MILAFTYPKMAELVAAGKKNQTRRRFTEQKWACWNGAWKTPGVPHSAWTAMPRDGGTKIFDVVLIAPPRIERLGDISDADFVAEGGKDAWRDKDEFFRLFARGQSGDVRDTYVIVLTFREFVY